MQDSIDTEKAALLRAASVLGGQAALASALGFADRRRVWPWFRPNRRVPAEYCIPIEKATTGRVRCEDLRADVDWGYLRRSAPPIPASADAAAKEAA